MVFDYKNYLSDFTSEYEIKTLLKEKLSSYFNCKYATLVVSGTVAIEIALKALCIKRGEGVIVPDISFIATATAVANCGLIPVYADINHQHFGITLANIKKKYSSKIKAVIVVHFAGYVNREIIEIKKFCEEKNIFLIEDCAQVFPCKINGNSVGTIGDVGTFSLQSSKVVNSGEGGIIITNSKEIAQRCESITNWGLGLENTPRDLTVPSSNFRLSGIQSYFVVKQLENIREIVDEQNKKFTEFLNASIQFGIQNSLPQSVPNIIDCPFFFVIKSKRKINTIEPRNEYPMRNSLIVRVIIRYFFPDLIKNYDELNCDVESDWNSDRILKYNDFINISNYFNISCENVLKYYLK